MYQVSAFNFPGLEGTITTARQGREPMRNWEEDCPLWEFTVMYNSACEQGTVEASCFFSSGLSLFILYRDDVALSFGGMRRRFKSLTCPLAHASIS